MSTVLIISIIFFMITNASITHCDLSQDLEVQQGDTYSVRYLSPPVSDFVYKLHRKVASKIMTSSSSYSHQYIDIETRDNNNHPCFLTFGLKGDRDVGEKTAEVTSPDFAQSMCSNAFDKCKDKHSSNVKELRKCVKCIGANITTEVEGQLILRGSIIPNTNGIKQLNDDQREIINGFLSNASRQSHTTKAGVVISQRVMKLRNIAFREFRHLYGSWQGRKNQVKINCILFMRLFDQSPRDALKVLRNGSDLHAQHQLESEWTYV